MPWSEYSPAAAAAFLALTALMVGGVAMAMTSRAGTLRADVLAAIGANPWPYLAGGVSLALVSLFDILTIPGLHAALGSYGRVLIVTATATAVIGDLLGIIGRLAQTALVPIGLQSAEAPGTELLAAGHVLNVLDVTINTALSGGQRGLRRVVYRNRATISTGRPPALIAERYLAIDAYRQPMSALASDLLRSGGR